MFSGSDYAACLLSQVLSRPHAQAAARAAYAFGFVDEFQVKRLQQGTLQVVLDDIMRGNSGFSIEF